jgi:hypothetical protein
MSETAIEKVTPGVSALVEVYAEDFTRALPRHIDGPQWIRNSLAALRKDKDLYAAANNNTPAAMRVLMEAARLGHGYQIDATVILERPRISPVT